MKIVLLFSLLVSACAAQVKPPAPPVPPPIPLPKGKKVIVAVFGAPWCSACKLLIPEVQKELDKLKKLDRDKIDFRLYVTTDANSSQKPTQATADKYKAILKLDATALIDPWYWTNFKRWVGPSLAIPAGAVLDDKEKVLKAYQPGAQFDPQEMVDFAESKVQD